MKTEFKTRSGYTLRIKAVPSAKIGLVQSKVRRELAAEGQPVEPPEITVKSADGQGWILQLQHNEETGQGNLDASTPEETERRHELWAAHQVALTRLQSEMWQQAMSVYLALGLEFPMPEEDAPEYAEWLMELEFLGREVPENKLEQKALFVTTRVLEDDELGKVLPMVMAVSQGDMVTEVQKESYFRSFYDSMARATATRFIEAGAALGRLEPEPAVPGAADGEGVGDQEPE